ncbi:MAG: UTP--glucose-1-phosphate uridylyltransferase [Thermodesulfobacteriota bacterium]|nr:UTP--glucose-1-phosphate uridylyltransferase [Thermodesulfobacteriota bacterium]
MQSDFTEKLNGYSQLIEAIVSENETLRNRSINSLLQNARKDDLLQYAAELNEFRTSSENLYHKVRASMYLFALYRFYLQENNKIPSDGKIPFPGVQASFNRDFEQAIHIYLYEAAKHGFTGGICSALADSYYHLAFDYLLDQVKLSISQRHENYHLFNTNGLEDYPFTVAKELTSPDIATGNYPVLLETCPVRLDPSHCGWSDIFFLGMDYPEGAKVFNISIDLKRHGHDGPLSPPCECYCRFSKEPGIHLTSIDLKASKKVLTIQELFDFGNDYLSLLKAGVVASGIVPPSFEKRDISVNDIMKTLMKKQGGIEVITRVNAIPKGSRLAVSTTLLATIISALMRFSGQIHNLSGIISNTDRKIIVSRAILGEWLGGSAGGWQDSGGLWPGFKVITGKKAAPGDPENGISRGCLLPEYNVLAKEAIPDKVEKRLLNSLVLVHGGISQDVGPILEMVTKKYLLRYEKEWDARKKGVALFPQIVNALSMGNMRKFGILTTEDWDTALQTIIPTVNNAFTESLISKVREEFRDDFWGFLMLGGMSGGGMAFVVDPSVKESFKERVFSIMKELKSLYRYSFPFIIDPVVYDFAVNHKGNTSYILNQRDARVPEIVLHSEEDYTGSSIENRAENASEIKERFGFDPISHEHMQTLLKKGIIGLSRNRLHPSTDVQDVRYEDLFHFECGNVKKEFLEIGNEAIRKDEVGVITLAGGLGSRWTSGAAVVKPVSPFVKMDEKYRTFIEIHLAKTRRTGQEFGCRLPHIFTTSYLTHDAIDSYIKKVLRYDGPVPIYLSSASTIGHRVYPMERDLRFLWEEQLHQKLVDTSQKVQDDLRRALVEWAKSKGEGEDYTENRPFLRFNPPGHWYEIPNMIKNGKLAHVLNDNPHLKYLLCHNIDTMGASIDPSILGMHIAERKTLTFEVTPRRIEDRGGGLARIDGHLRLIEGLALPREEDEYILSYYNTLTHWISIDALLGFFQLDRDLILRAEGSPELKEEIVAAIHIVEKRIPTYVTIKHVKYLWGHGQTDVYPVAQFEKLWGDMSSLSDLLVGYAAVTRFRGQQLKDLAQLNAWLIDGSFDYVKAKVRF